MKKIIIVTMILILGVAVYGWALPDYTGTLTHTSGLTATNALFGPNLKGWNPSASLTWNVFNPANISNLGSGYWEYVYTFTVDEKGISHMIIEVSSDNPNTANVNEQFTAANLKTGSTPNNGIDTYTSTSHGNSNTGMPAGPGMYGIKWNTPAGTELLSFMVTIVTDRMPMWGDFFAIDGKAGTAVYAYNNGFGVDFAFDPNNPTNPGSKVLVPDTLADNGNGNGNGNGGPGQQIPEPGTLLLLGSGLVGFGIFGRRKFRK